MPRSVAAATSIASYPTPVRATIFKRSTDSSTRRVYGSVVATVPSTPISSAITSLASVSTMDFVKQMLPHRDDEFFLRFSKYSSVFWAGVLVFIGLYGFSLWATSHDPDMLRIIMASSGARQRYDPGKHERFDVEVVRW